MRRGRSSLETDAGGRFTLVVRDPLEEWSLELVHAETVHDRVDAVRTGDEVVLRASSEAELGRIQGVFADEGERVPAGERVTAQLAPQAGGGFRTADLDEGAFAFEGVRPDRYRVRVRTAALLLASSDWVDVAPGVTLDVGRLRSRAAGSLAVDFVVPPGYTLSDEGAYVYGPDGEGRVLVRSPDAWRAPGLNPGRHVLSLDFAGLAHQQCAFDVQEGMETCLTIALERGVERTLVFVPAPGVTCPSVEVVLRGASWEWSGTAFGPERPELPWTLAPGRYEVEARSSSGLTARGAFEILDLALDHAELSFELR